jgi:hypothetical protein
MECHRRRANEITGSNIEAESGGLWHCSISNYQLTAKCPTWLNPAAAILSAGSPTRAEIPRSLPALPGPGQARLALGLAHGLQDLCAVGRDPLGRRRKEVDVRSVSHNSKASDGLCRQTALSMAFLARAGI